MKTRQAAKVSNSGQPPLPSSAALLGEAANLRKAGDLTRAEELLGSATSLYPLSAGAWSELGEVMVETRRYSEAAACLNRAVELSKPSGQTLFSLARAHMELGEYEKARVRLRGALQVEPALQANATLLSADISAREQDWKAAAAGAARFLEMAPDHLYALLLHARACDNLVHMPEAIGSARRALSIQPNLEIHHWLLQRLNCLAETTPESLYEESCRWDALHAAPLASERRAYTNTPDPDRRLRVGYVSPDLKNHALYKSIAPVFEHHDRAAFEVFVYSLGSERDSFTDQIESTMANFVTLPLSRHGIAERVRADQIDILVDLAGHSMRDAQGYLAFALKPAPIQVSWLGALATTGLSTMDYVVGGPEFPYRGTEHLFSEKVYRLPRVSCCYRPLTIFAVADRPCSRNGYITFGSFNSPIKITRDVVKVWSLILHLVPHSRLLCKHKDLEKADVNERIRKWFLEDAIAPERIEFEGASDGMQYMHSWGKVDIALDPFPYTGGTTTLDALWAGVPVVTLNGRLPVQAGGASLLAAAGLPFAETPEQYVSLALLLAKNSPDEPEIRKRVREAIASSPLMDEPGLVRSIEAAYREMWRGWCQTQN